MTQFFAVMLLLAGPAMGADRVPLDSASPEQLASIDGVDLSLANQIVALRAERGTVGSVDALRVIPGITDANLTALRGGTTVAMKPIEASVKEYDSVEAVLGNFRMNPPFFRSSPGPATTPRPTPR